MAAREREPEFVEEPDDALDGPVRDPDYRRRSAPVRVRRKRPGEWLRRLQRHWRAEAWATAGCAALLGGYAFFFHSAWFVLASSGQIAVAGASHGEASAVAGVFASDLGRDIFFIPIEARRESIAALPWVRSATVLRVWPAQLQVRLTERTPVALARAGSSLRLVDGGGVLLTAPEKGNFDFPVLSGLAGAEAANPDARRWLQARAPQMERFAAFRDALAQGGKLSEEISEIDLSESEDLRARIGVGRTSVLVHFGDRNFAARFALFQQQIEGWEQKFPGLASVDLRYDGQAIVDPGTAAKPAAATPAKATAKPAAKARGTKPGGRG